MKYINIIIILLSALNTETRYLRITHYDNVTLRSCGWSSHSFETANTNCFSWHKTYKQIRTEQAIAGIRGGRYAKIGEFPYNALIWRNIWIDKSIEEKGMIECSGVIINTKWIVTAAHCLKNIESMSNFSVFVGHTFYPQYLTHGTPMNVTNVYLHPNYVGHISHIRNDIGLIKLGTEIDFRSDTVNSVCLPGNMFEIETNRDDYGIACGWGQTNPNQLNEIRLKTLKVRLNATQTDKNWFESYRNTSGMLCGGDSGAPLVKLINGRAVLIGIYRGSRPGAGNCRESEMGFVSVPNKVSWIVETIKTKS